MDVPKMQWFFSLSSSSWTSYLQEIPATIRPQKFIWILQLLRDPRILHRVDKTIREIKTTQSLRFINVVHFSYILKSSWTELPFFMLQYCWIMYRFHTFNAVEYCLCVFPVHKKPKSSTVKFILECNHTQETRYASIHAWRIFIPSQFWITLLQPFSKWNLFTEYLNNYM